MAPAPPAPGSWVHYGSGSGAIRWSSPPIGSTGATSPRSSLAPVASRCTASRHTSRSSAPPPSGRPARSTSSQATTTGRTATFRSTIVRRLRCTSGSGFVTRGVDGTMSRSSLRRQLLPTRRRSRGWESTCTSPSVCLDLILYRATVQGSAVFTKSWTFEMTLSLRDNVENQIYKAACHKRNYAMTNVLSGARSSERSTSVPAHSRYASSARNCWWIIV